MAERQGFEPWVPVRVRRISSAVHSTTLASLLFLMRLQNYCFCGKRQRKKGKKTTGYSRKDVLPGNFYRPLSARSSSTLRNVLRLPVYHARVIRLSGTKILTLQISLISTTTLYQAAHIHFMQKGYRTVPHLLRRLRRHVFLH